MIRNVLLHDNPFFYTGKTGKKGTAQNVRCPNVEVSYMIRMDYSRGNEVFGAAMYLSLLSMGIYLDIFMKQSEKTGRNEPSIYEASGT